MRTPRFRLRSTVGRNTNVDPNDARDIKVALRDLGYLEAPYFGMTPYPDAHMFEGIEDFQDDFDLHKDGMMAPNGETEQKLNEVVDLTTSTEEDRPNSVAPAVTMPNFGPSPSDRSESSVPEPSENDRQQVVMLPIAIPIIVYEIAMYFGMSLTAAYAWWLLRSPEEKRRVRAEILKFSVGQHAQNPSDAECEALFKIDIDTCRQIAKKRGRQAGQRCYAMANERYAACLRGKPREQWPPLDTWNN